VKISILTYGSRGDVQPFLALAVGLRNAGHEVVLAAPHRFSEFIKSYDIECEPLAGDPDELSLLLNQAGSNPFKMVQSMQKHVVGIAPDVVRGVRRALVGADLIIHSFAFTTGAHSYACELGIPDISIQMFPVFAPTRQFPAIGVNHSKRGWFNYFSHWFSTKVFWHIGNAGYYQLRKKAPDDFPAKLFWPFKPSNSRIQTPLIFAISQLILSTPKEWSTAQIHQPGYFFLEEQNYNPPSELVSFMNSGQPPICVTFGSMVNPENQRITRSILAAAKSLRERVIILTGWGGWQPEVQNDTIFCIESVPHQWLFPRCKQVIHHGGAGTTAAGLRAGIPELVIPHAADQPFWGKRIEEMGIGPAPIPIKKATTENLILAIKQSNSEAIKNKAAKIGLQIQTEQGVEKAVVMIEKHAEMFFREAK